MQTALESIKEMVDVNTIVSDAVETPDGSVVIPISRVSFGLLLVGGIVGEVLMIIKIHPLPGVGPGVSIQPVAFSGGAGSGKAITVDSRAMYDRLIDLAPQVLKQLGLVVEEGGKVGDEFGPPPPDYQPWE